MCMIWRSRAGCEGGCDELEKLNFAPLRKGKAGGACRFIQISNSIRSLYVRMSIETSYV